MIEFWRDYQAWIVGIAALVVALAVAYGLYRAAYFVLARIARRAPGIGYGSLVRRSRAPVGGLVLVLVFVLALPGVPLAPRAEAIVHHLAALVLTGMVGWLVINCVGVVSDVVASRFDISDADNLRARQVWTQTQLMRRFAVGVVVVLTVCIMLMSIPGVRQVGISLFASAGVAGIVIGMAAQQVLKNVLAGVQLALTDPVRVQDTVIVQGESGTIEEIRSTYIVVKTWDLRRLVVPLSYFIEQPFQNWTRVPTNMLGTIFLYVDYTVPVDRVRERFEALVKANALWDGTVCGFQVTDVKDRTIELRGLVSAKMGNVFDLRCQLREAMVGWLQSEYPESLPRIRADVRTGDTNGAGTVEADRDVAPRSS
jgi:small-conductance mechanosensitive channel